MKKVSSTKVMKKYIVTIPKAIRIALDLKPGDFIDWFIDEDKVIVRKSGER